MARRLLTALVCLALASLAFGQEPVQPLAATPVNDSVLALAERYGVVPASIIAFIGYKVQGWVTTLLDLGKQTVENGIPVKVTISVSDDFGVLLTQMRKTADKAVTNGFTVNVGEDEERTPPRYQAAHRGRVPEVTS